MTDTEMSTVTEHYYRGHLTDKQVPFQHYGSFYLRMGAVGTHTNLMDAVLFMQ
jgi:hypothetical protein